MATMFANADDGRTRIAVSLTLASGVVLHGNVAGGMTGKLKDVINHADRYLEVEKRDGTVSYVLKETIVSAEKFDAPKADQLARRITETANFDPWRILGIERTAGPAEVRTAYWARAKQYHPDKFNSTDAPREVIDFMNAMFQRIHAAYRELSNDPEAA